MNTNNTFKEPLSAEDESILEFLEAQVLTLSFNRLSHKNALTQAMYSRLTQCLQDAARNPEVRVLVLQASPLVFCAGNDIADFVQNPVQGMDAPALQFLAAIASFPKPILAGVCGPAVGVGTTMLLHCDLVYAGDNALFSMPFVSLGLCAEGASSLLLPQMLGQQRAAQALLMGEVISAETALEWGMVSALLVPDEVNAHVQKQARKLAQKPEQAVMETKRLMKQSASAAVQNQLQVEASVFAKLLQTPVAQQAFSAFLDKPKASSAPNSGSK